MHIEKVYGKRNREIESERNNAFRLQALQKKYSENVFRPEENASIM